MNLLNQMGPVVARWHWFFLLAAVIGLSVLSYKMYNKLNKIETAYPQENVPGGTGKNPGRSDCGESPDNGRGFYGFKEVAAKMEKLESDMARAIQNVGMWFDTEPSRICGTGTVLLPGTARCS
ncbi:hypothetical protein [Proteiniclasticum sp. QWL-01]|uniref:hypothetical protein n=1 Tax=Proteiniclasticum sp. QWL-01 TaxID=3036945 RepID=UPI00240F3BAB|nr:hypothetical protein [Proteiniclasticum sp. QWL-01]WFF72894.1 hypothetical protein P6M73_16800 [Proteiniclasticum sp. QWL-01]